MGLVSHKLRFAFSLYLGVGLAAVGADVSLHVFGIAMLGDVLQQRWLVCEALVAGVALVRLVTLMASRMRLQVRQLRECLRATWGTKRLARLWWGKIRSSGGFCQKCSLLTGLTDILSGRKKSRNEVELGAIRQKGYGRSDRAARARRGKNNQTTFPPFCFNSPGTLHL